MRKNYIILKPYILALILLLTTTIIIYSCKKDHTDDVSYDSTKLSEWYQNNIVLKFNTDFVSLSPVWKNVIVHKKTDYIVYEVELENPHSLVLPFNTNNLTEESAKANLRVLLFEDNVSKKIKFASYMYIENDNKLDFKKLQYGSFEQLTGKVIFYHQNGNMANGWIFNNGKIVSQTAPITSQQFKLMNQSKQGLSGEKLMTGAGQDCKSVPIESFFWACVGATGHEGCGWQSKGMSYITICRTGVTLGDEDTTIDHIKDEDLGLYWPPVDCKGDDYGTARLTDDCGCIEGNTGITECPREIIDSVKNQCIKAQLANALSAKTTIRNMLNETFGGTVQFESLNLTFTDVTTLPDNISGDAGRASATSIYFDIRLNANKLPGYSQEYILSTIYHEILHAYMFSKLTMGSDGKYNISTQHEDMANKYLILMTGALKIAFPNISSQDAWALSWGGLEGTNLYTSKLTQEQRDAINEVNGKYMNKSTSPKQGTYCN